MPIKTLTDIEALEAIPFDQLDLAPNTYEHIRRGAALNPNAPALHFFLQADQYKTPLTLSFRELVEQITRAANMFHALGIHPVDVISYVLPALPQTHFTIWGGEAAGIVNAINPLLEAHTIADIMNAAHSKMLVTLAPFPQTDIWQKIDAIREAVPTLQTILLVDLANYIPSPMRDAVRGQMRPLREVPGQTILDFDSELAKQPGDHLVSGRVIQPHDIASYFHTGGTTGTPKIARHTHANEVFDAWTSAQALELTQGKVLFCGLPLFHVNGVIVTGLIPFGVGATVVLGTPQGYRGAGVLPSFWRIIEHYRVNFFSGVPTVYAGLLDVPIGDTDVSSLEFAICGAAPMPVEVFRKFEALTGLRILEGYGLTEGTCVSSVNPTEGDRRVGSVGYRLPYTELKVIKLGAKGDYERDCEPDEIGAVVTRGANIFPGYLEEHHNRGLWVEAPDGKGRWMNTGDMGRMDADGYLWLTGRLKELIIRGGHNIDPAVIEGALHKHPAVALAAALGRPDDYAGEVPVAYVQLAPGKTATEEELLQFAASSIGERAALPKAIHIVEQIPQTAVGKIFKPALKSREIEDVYRAETLAADARIRAAQVTVQPDKLKGTQAAIHLLLEPGSDASAIEAAVRARLDKFTVAYVLTSE